MGNSINSVRAEKVIKEYADDVAGPASSLTDRECTELRISTDNCDMLQRVLGWGSEGRISLAEREKLIDAGFARQFVENLAGTDGKKTLRARVKWLTHRLDYFNLKNDQRQPEMFQQRDEIRVVTELHDISPDAKEAIDALAKVAGDKYQNVTARRIAIRALGKMGPDAERAVPALIMALMNDQCMKLRNDAALALGAIGPGARYAVPYLIIALEEPSLRVNVTWALGKIGPDARHAVRELITMLEDENPKVSVNAAGALGCIGPDAEKAVPELERALNSENPDLRKHAAWALGQIGSAARSSMATLETMAKEDPSLPCQYASREALAKLKGR